ncbi:Carboxylesterase [Nocardia seriolae]|uniref:Carboxylic ester hydrolase n=1 Tax=Nocardia seriolae TaxID=37332 RepID=A0ABC8APE5_9NOCA|nr:Carboxylesterase [Nocardia seriolae]
MSTRFFDTPSGSNDTPSGRAGVPVAKTGSGEVAGSLDGRIAVWRGIPYAASVGGPNRFRTPQPPLAWTGVRDCTDFGDVAPQSPGFVPVDGSLRMGEDCLWLNVWAPADPSDELRPVMVWLHGGAFCLGTAAQAIYDGKRLAETGDVIVVGVNYRLGALGFLDLSSLGDEFVPNLGLHDQIAALRWVRDNAAAFGGDPGNVTVFGESSGAGCVTALLTSPLSAGLFHRAIAQSPPATTVFGPERAALVAKRYLELLEITPDRAVELLTMPVERIIAAAGTLLDEVPLREPGRLAAAPVVDGNLLPAYPSERFQQGRSHRVPLIIGTNRDEASLFRLFRSPIMPVTPDAVNEMLRGWPPSIRACRRSGWPRSPRPTRRPRPAARSPCPPTPPSACPRTGSPTRTPRTRRPGCTASTTPPRCSRRPGSVRGTPPNCPMSSAISAPSNTTPPSGWADAKRHRTFRAA